MNDFVFAEFMFEYDEHVKGALSIIGMGDDFILIESGWQDDHMEDWYKVSGKLNSATATAIKLSDKFLSDRMRVSYIPDKLKDKYRK